MMTLQGSGSPPAAVAHTSSNGYYGYCYVNAMQQQPQQQQQVYNNNNNNIIDHTAATSLVGGGVGGAGAVVGCINYNNNNSKITTMNNYIINNNNNNNSNYNNNNNNNNNNNTNYNYMENCDMVPMVGGGGGGVTTTTTTTEQANILRMNKKRVLLNGDGVYNSTTPCVQADNIDGVSVKRIRLDNNTAASMQQFGNAIPPPFNLNAMQQASRMECEDDINTIQLNGTTQPTMMEITGDNTQNIVSPILPPPPSPPQQQQQQQQRYQQQYHGHLHRANRDVSRCLLSHMI